MAVTGTRSLGVTDAVDESIDDCLAAGDRADDEGSGSPGALVPCSGTTLDVVRRAGAGPDP